MTAVASKSEIRARTRSLCACTAGVFLNLRVQRLCTCAGGNEAINWMLSARLVADTSKVPR